MSRLQSSSLNILQQSPHDLCEPTKAKTEHLDALIPDNLVPSRYNVRATAGDGRMILWNTYSGSISVFQPDQISLISSLLKKKGVQGQKGGIVQFLKERGFLIAEGTDELRNIKLDFGRQHYRNNILELILLASEDCNFRCNYCYEKFERGTMQPEVREGIKRLIEKRLDLLQILTVSWFGGEPLYGFQAIKDLAPYFCEIADKNGLRYFSSMTTNGYLLTPDIAEMLLKWRVSQYQITLDGPPEHHDCSRPTRDGNGTFSRIFENIKHLSKRKEDFSVRVRVNFDNKNHSSMGSFLDLLEKELKDDARFKVNFHAVGKWGGPNDEDLDVCGANESKRLIAELKTLAKEKGLNLGGDIKEVNRFGSAVCYAARPYNFIVGASGKLMKCTIALDTEDYNVVGQLENNGEMTLDQTNMALWTEPAFDSDKKCQKCIVLPNCQGIHCPLIRIEHNKSPCTSLRSNLKPQLLRALDRPGGKSKKTLVKSNAY